MDFKEVVHYIDSANQKDIVSILVLCSQTIEINTISEMARLENKTPRGIRISDKYMKIKIGKQTFAVKGLSNTNIPF